MIKAPIEVPADAIVKNIPFILPRVAEGESVWIAAEVTTHSTLTLAANSAKATASIAIVGAVAASAIEMAVAKKLLAATGPRCALLISTLMSTRLHSSDPMPAAARITSNKSTTLPPSGSQPVNGLLKVSGASSHACARVHHNCKGDCQTIATSTQSN